MALTLASTLAKLSVSNVIPRQKISWTSGMLDLVSDFIAEDQSLRSSNDP